MQKNGGGRHRSTGGAAHGPSQLLTHQGELAIEALGLRGGIFERSGASRVLDRGAHGSHADGPDFKRAASQPVGDFPHRFLLARRDGGAKRRQMDRDIGEKQAGYFCEDIRLARATERSDGSRHRHIEDSRLRCRKTHGPA